MNVENFRRLRDYIAGLPPDACDQGTFGWVNDGTMCDNTYCGTVACIAGHCALMLGYRVATHPVTGAYVNESGRERLAPDIATEFLGMERTGWSDEVPFIFMPRVAISRGLPRELADRVCATSDQWFMLALLDECIAGRLDPETGAVREPS